MPNAFRLSELLALETASERALASGDRALVDALQEPLADMDVAALERVPETRDEMRDLLELASKRSPAETADVASLCLRLGRAGESGVDMLIALRSAIALAENDSDAIYVRQIATNALCAMTRLRLVEGGAPSRIFGRTAEDFFEPTAPPEPHAALDKLDALFFKDALYRKEVVAHGDRLFLRLETFERRLTDIRPRSDLGLKQTEQNAGGG